MFVIIVFIDKSCETSYIVISILNNANAISIRGVTSRRHRTIFIYFFHSLSHCYNHIIHILKSGGISLCCTIHHIFFCRCQSRSTTPFTYTRICSQFRTARLWPKLYPLVIKASCGLYSSTRAFPYVIFSLSWIFFVLYSICINLIRTQCTTLILYCVVISVVRIIHCFRLNDQNQVIRNSLIYFSILYIRVIRAQFLFYSRSN